MRYLNILATRVATLLVLHAAGAGMASPAVLISKSMPRVAAEWLPTDNQTVYRLVEGERRSLELNTSTITQASVFITISPCTKDFHWALYYGKAGNSNGHLSLIKEDSSGEMKNFSLLISQNDKYLLQLWSVRGGSGAVSVRGEAPSAVRLRLRVRSRRRLSANWDPSPIDPQETTYCVVASHQRNYTSLCAAQYDLKLHRYEKLNRMIDSKNDRYDVSSSIEVDNKIDVDSDSFSLYEGNFRNVFRRKKISRSTKVTDEDPVIACVGDRTHHLIENLDPTKMYSVSVFGVNGDRMSGALLARNAVRARPAPRRLKEDVPVNADVKAKTVYYFKAFVGVSNGAWFTLTTCGGAVDVEVLVKGKRLYHAKNIDPQTKFFVPAPKTSSASIQETSDEGSVQFDSSSEESKVRYVIKIVPSRRDRISGVNIELTGSLRRWGAAGDAAPELCAERRTARELRARRGCHAAHLAFLPAEHNATDVIRYCITVWETNGEHYSCGSKSALKYSCVNYELTQPSKVIVEKISGLQPGRKYAVQIVASNRGRGVPYDVLYVETSATCKNIATVTTSPLTH